MGDWQEGKGRGLGDWEWILSGHMIYWKETVFMKSITM